MQVRPALKTNLILFNVFKICEFSFYSEKIIKLFLKIEVLVCWKDLFGVVAPAGNAMTFFALMTFKLNNKQKKF